MILPLRKYCANTIFGLVVAGMAVYLAAAILELPVEVTGLSDDVEEVLHETGVRNRVTAVLLNLRAYDTLLEVVVLFLAVLGARVLSSACTGRERVDTGGDSRVLRALVRFVAPFMIMVAGYLLWAGGNAPGGAFQAGAVLAALGVLMRVSGCGWPGGVSATGERWLLAIGPTVFLAMAGLSVVTGHLLEWRLAVAKYCILTIELFVMLSTAATLLALFCGGFLGNQDVRS